MLRTVAATRYVTPLREGWLVSPSSTIIQPSGVHPGLTDDPAAELAHLFQTLVGDRGSERSTND